MAGAYEPRQVRRGLTAGQIHKYFEHRGDRWVARPALRKLIEFRRVNLVQPFSGLGAFDVILCRNVIIYFDLTTKKRVMKSFHEKLRPGGCLLLGHSESLANVTTAFELKHLKRELVYRRPVLGEERDDLWHSLARAGIDAAEE